MSIDLEIAPYVEVDDEDVEFLDGIGPFNRDSIVFDAMVTIEGVSVEEWAMFSPPPRIREYIDGAVYTPNAPTDEHQDVVAFMMMLAGGCRDGLGLGIVRLGPAVLRLNDQRYLMPDLFVLPPERVEGGPPAVLVLEVLSKSTRLHDLVLKSRLYREAAIPEILSLDLKERHLLVARLVDGEYRSETISEGFWRSSAWPGLWVDVAWLWGGSHPPPLECIRVILDGPPA